MLLSTPIPSGVQTGRIDKIVTIATVAALKGEAAIEGGEGVGDKAIRLAMQVGLKVGSQEQ